jgi:hypothetical protein
MIGRYVASLQIAVEHKDIPKPANTAALRQIAYMLVGMRNYLYLAYITDTATDKSLEKYVAVYLQFVRSALS